MKIIDFVPYYPPHIGGLENYAEELHQNLSAKGNQITVFTSYLPATGKKIEKKQGVTIIRYPAFEIISGYPLPSIWKFEFWRQWKKIKSSNFDIVVSMVRFFIQPLMALFYAKTKKIPLIHIEHCSNYVKNRLIISIIAKFFDKTLGRFILVRANKIIAVSKPVALFIKVLANKSSSIIYRGMPFSEIDGISPKYDLRERFKEKKIITYVGRVFYGKGIIHLLEAIKNINRNDIALVIVGDGPERKNLEKYAKKNNLNGQVLFYGSVPFKEAISILKVSDIFINPSYSEGLPTSIMEAGACGRAIIATDVGGTSEIIINERSGIIIKPYSTKLLEDALKRLLDNPELRAELGENARKQIESKFKWESAINEFEKEFLSCLKK